MSANDPEVIVKLKITLRQGKIRLARIRTFGHLENASACVPTMAAEVNWSIRNPIRDRVRST